MPQSVTIACQPSWELASFARFLEAIARDEAGKFSAFDDQLQVTIGDAETYLGYVVIINEATDRAEIAAEYATFDVFNDPGERFRREVGKLRFFSVRFRNFDVTRRFLSAIARDVLSRGETAWIDTDYGWIIHMSDFLKKTEEDANWDWRKILDESFTIACQPRWELASFAGFLETIARDEAAEFSAFDKQLQAVAQREAWRLLVNEDTNWLDIATDYATFDVFNDPEERFLREADKLRFFRVRFDDIDVARRFLSAIAGNVLSRGETAWIDTHYRWIIHMSDFLKKTEEDANWDWRKNLDEN